MLAELASCLDTCCATRRMNRASRGWASTSRSDIRFFKGKLASYRYRERGNGKPIVFAADPPVTVELYDELLDLYAKKYRVIVFELPGMGFSVPRFGMSYRFHPVNDAIIEFLEGVIEQPAVLAFSCVAGLGAVDIACRRPDLVEKLVLIQTPSWEQEIAWKESRDSKKILAKPFFGQIAMQLLKRKRAPDWLDLAVGRRDMYDHFCEGAIETLDQGAAWTLASAFQLYLAGQVPSLLKAKQPTLALWGLSDKSHETTDKRSSLALCDHGQLVTYDGLGHFPDLEDVAKVYDDISQFVGT